MAQEQTIKVEKSYTKEEMKAEIAKAKAEAKVEVEEKLALSRYLPKTDTKGGMLVKESVKNFPSLDFVKGKKSSSWEVWVYSILSEAITSGKLSFNR